MSVLNLNPDPHLRPAPEQGAADYGLAIAKVAGLAFPLVGSGVALFDLLTAPIRGRRIDNWYEDVRIHLNDLHQKVHGMTPEGLAQNEAFFSALVQASLAALKTHQTEKLTALRNTVLNSAIGQAPTEDKQLLFLNFVDRFGPLHLRLLKFAENTEPYIGKWHTHNLPAVHLMVYRAIPELDGELPLLNAILGELNSFELIAVKSGVQQIPTFSRWITNFGAEFLRFIEEPDINSTFEQIS